ncbi:MAG: FAD-dependent oxidoreductase [Simkaniaceae bacterium]
MKWAVIGGGLAGLASCYHLLSQGHQNVVLYEKKGIGGGASGSSTGLLHPFAGENIPYSSNGFESLKQTLDLVDVVERELGYPVAIRNGILRLIMKESQRPHFIKRSKEYKGVEFFQDSTQLIPSLPSRSGVFIREGVTVFTKLYLQGLFQVCRKMGLVHKKHEVTSCDQLDADRVILAVGANLSDFIPDLPIKMVKGQSLFLRGKIERSVIGKGHISLTEDSKIVQIGSTYEHYFQCPGPDIERAKELIYPKIQQFCPEVLSWPLIDCKAGIRVAPVSGYEPIVELLSNHTVFITALGSRGLLYHAAKALRAIHLIK